MKLRALRLANAIKAGSRQADFLEAKSYDMEFADPVRIRVSPKNKPDDAVETSIFNAIWWVPLAEKEPTTKRGK